MRVPEGIAQVRRSTMVRWCLRNVENAAHYNLNSSSYYIGKPTRRSNTVCRLFQSVTVAVTSLSAGTPSPVVIGVCKLEAQHASCRSYKRLNKRSLDIR